MRTMYEIPHIIQFLSRLVLCVFIIFIACIPVSSIASDFHSNYEKIPAVNKFPIRVAHWSRTPTVIVCEYAPISKKQVKKAVAFWEKLGYRFFKSQYNYDPLNKCIDPAPIGYIIVHLVSSNTKMEHSDLAETHFFVDNYTGSIDWAKIYMKPDVRETVLEHEIGHALGFLHYNKINHIMNAKWTQGGWDSEGLKKK